MPNADMRDFAKDITFSITPTQLNRPFSYSREQQQLATFGEFVTSRFPRAALELGLVVTRPQEQLPLAEELTPEEIKEVSLARQFSASQSAVEVVFGGPRYDAKQRMREIAEGTPFGQELTQRTKTMLLVYQDACADVRIEKAPDPID